MHAIQGSSFLLKLATICKGKLILSREEKDILIRYWTHGQTLYSTRAGTQVVTQVHKRHGDAVPGPRIRVCGCEDVMELKKRSTK